MVPFWAHLDFFWIISDKIWFFASKTQSASWPKWFVAKNQVLSKMIQKSPIGPKMAPNGQKHVILIILGSFQIMTVIQLWHHLIQIIWVIQLTNSTMIISWVARGSLPRWRRGGPREAKLTPDYGLNFQSFRSRVLPKALYVGSILKAGLPSSLPKWGRWDPVRPSWRPSPRLSSASQFYTSLRLVDRICFFSDEKYFVMSSSSLSWSLMTKVKIFKVHFAFKLNMVYLWLKSQKKSDIEIRSRN